jgi:hypothetical protein
MVMQMELRLMVAAIAATLPMLSAGAAQTINFGTQPGLPTFPTGGTVPNGYDGFNWHGAQNEVFFDQTSTGFGSAFITEMSRTTAFDLDTMTVSPLESSLPSPGETSNLTTTISGYLNGTLVETLTETYSAIATGNPLILNMDGVNDVKFKTIDTRQELDLPGMPTITGPDLTMVTQMTVDNFTGVAKAPEMDPAASASAVTLLLGSLLVIMGRPSRRSRPSSGVRLVN